VFQNQWLAVLNCVRKGSGRTRSASKLTGDRSGIGTQLGARPDHKPHTSWRRIIGFLELQDHQDKQGKSTFCIQPSPQ
jgi:hypothetical protein